MVIDASAAVNAASREMANETTAELVELLDSEKFIAPRFFGIEAANSAWKYYRAGLYSEEKAAFLIASTAERVDEFYDDGPLVQEAFREAMRCNHPVYDMLYFVLARRKGIPLLTADKKLERVCDESGVASVMILGL